MRETMVRWGLRNKTTGRWVRGKDLDYHTGFDLNEIATYNRRRLAKLDLIYSFTGLREDIVPRKILVTVEEIE